MVGKLGSGSTTKLSNTVVLEEITKPPKPLGLVKRKKRISMAKRCYRLRLSDIEKLERLERIIVEMGFEREVAKTDVIKMLLRLGEKTNVEKLKVAYKESLLR